MHTHKKDVPNPERYKLLNKGLVRYKRDGFNSVKYKLIEKQVKPLYTKFIVEYDKTQS